MSPRSWLLCTLLAAASCAVCLEPASAGLISYHDDLYVVTKTPGVGSEIRLGDIFYWQLTMDASATDFDPSLTAGRFDNFVKLDLVRKPSNAGSWDPSQDTWPLGSNVTYSPAGLFDWQLVLDGAPSLSPLTINGNPAGGNVVHFLASATVNDTGFGQTWAEQLLGPRGTFFAFDIQWEDQHVLLQAFDYFAVGPHPQISSAPEPASVLLLGLGLTGLGVLARRRKRST